MKKTQRWCVYVLSAFKNDWSKNQMLLLAQILRNEGTVNDTLLVKYGLDKTMHQVRKIIHLTND